MECPPLSRPDSGYLSCSGENNSFNITCQFKCYSGFMMEGPPNVTCGPNGDWSGPRPVCTGRFFYLCFWKTNNYTKTNFTGFVVSLNGRCFVIMKSSIVWHRMKFHVFFLIFSVYKLALLGVLGCGALLSICCISLCYKKHRNSECFTMSLRLWNNTLVIAPDIDNNLLVWYFLTGKKLAQLRLVLKCALPKQLHPWMHIQCLKS